MDITLAEKNTDSDVPLSETESMFPHSATRVIAIMRIDHSRSGVVVKPSSSLKSAGAKSNKSALRPKTVDPAARTLRK